MCPWLSSSWACALLISHVINPADDLTSGSILCCQLEFTSMAYTLTPERLDGSASPPPPPPRPAFISRPPICNGLKAVLAAETIDLLDLNVGPLSLFGEQQRCRSSPLTRYGQAIAVDAKLKGAAWLERGKAGCETTETFCVIAPSRSGDPLSVPLKATQSGVDASRLATWCPQHTLSYPQSCEAEIGYVGCRSEAHKFQLLHFGLLTSAVP
jgi:hypothetical protein